MRILPADEIYEILAFYQRPDIAPLVRDDTRPAMTTKIAKKIVDDCCSAKILDDRGLAGFITIEPIMDIALAHIAVLPRIRGRQTTIACYLAMDYLGDLGFHYLRLLIPSCNKPAQHLATRLGFLRNPDNSKAFAWRKDGVYYDLIAYQRTLECLPGLSKQALQY